MLELVCPSCGGYLCHDYYMNNLMSCLYCQAVYRLILILVSTDCITIPNKTEQGEYNYG